MFYENLIGSKVLVTTNAWFYAPDGKNYRAIFGTLKSVDEVKNVLGFTPSRSNANWMLQIGDCVVMGCQVMYLIKTDSVNTAPVEGWDSDAANGIKVFERPAAIYVTT